MEHLVVLVVSDHGCMHGSMPHKKSTAKSSMQHKLVVLYLIHLLKEL
jgi:hypothetical protein